MHFDVGIKGFDAADHLGSSDYLNRDEDEQRIHEFRTTYEHKFTNILFQLSTPKILLFHLNRMLYFITTELELTRNKTSELNIILHDSTGLPGMKRHILNIS
jgi:hypothetical protein